MRVQYVPAERVYQGHVRSPSWKGDALLKRSDVKRRSPGVTTPEAYDDAAMTFLKWAALESPAKAGQALPIETGEDGEPVMRRVFQAPCPTAGRVQRRGRSR